MVVSYDLSRCKGRGTRRHIPEVRKLCLWLSRGHQISQLWLAVLQNYSSFLEELRKITNMRHVY